MIWRAITSRLAIKHSGVEGCEGDDDDDDDDDDGDDVWWCLMNDKFLDNTM